MIAKYWSADCSGWYPPGPHSSPEHKKFIEQEYHAWKAFDAKLSPEDIVEMQSIDADCSALGYGVNDYFSTLLFCATARYIARTWP